MYIQQIPNLEILLSGLPSSVVFFYVFLFGTEFVMLYCSQIIFKGAWPRNILKPEFFFEYS